MSDTSSLDFEQAFIRLEEILEKMNEGQPSLDEALKLYEEADRLIFFCTHRLNEAERKIEILIKKRDGNIVCDSQGNPQTENFIPSLAETHS